MKKCILLFITFILFGCSEDQASKIKDYVSPSAAENLYGEYAYVNNSDGLKMNGELELIYEKKGNQDLFLAKIDVDRSTNDNAENCQISGTLSMLDSNTYLIKNFKDKTPSFSLLLKRDPGSMTIVKNEELSKLCPGGADAAIFQKYLKVN